MGWESWVEGWVFLGVAALGLLVSVRVSKRFQADVEARRTRARAQMREFRAASPDARYAFDGGTARIVSEHELIPDQSSGAGGYTLTCYAVNEAGEYFMFIADGAAKPFFKHVEPRIARVVLKDKFREPGTV